jgi:hypothetical protein
MKRAIVILLIALAIIGRLVPHPDNFTPVLGVALFAGAMLPGSAAYLIAFAAVFLSDLALGNSFTGTTVVVYACFLVGAALGKWLGRERTWRKTALATLGGSLLFYVATNFAVWMEPGGLYPRTWDGLLECYWMAIPFFRNSLAGDIFWTVALFGLFDLGQWSARRQRADRPTAT